MNTWERLPAEMRVRDQWLIAAPDKSPWTVKDGKAFRGSTTEPSQWLPFDVACHHAREWGADIGYVLSASDPFSCIDLDVVDAGTQKTKGVEVDPRLWTTKEQLDRFWAIVQAFNSFTELSRSGKGLHVWVLGNIGSGGKRDGVEVYSQERFMICTGNVVLAEPIKPGGISLEMLVQEIKRERAFAELVEIPEKEPDEVIWKRALSADNGEKFRLLCEGKWAELGYKSQSEADFSLMSMFTFYSNSNEQCRRMFRLTALGQRDKATKNNRYLDLTLIPLRARIAKERARMDAIKAQAEALVSKVREPEAVASLVAGLQTQAANRVGVNVPETPPAAVALANMAPAPLAVEQPEGGLDWPPGLCGALASFIYKSSPRPVKEVAIVAALGLLAGICGRCYNIPQSGLNIYLILIARSAVGKEAMHSGISIILQSIMNKGYRQISQFVNFQDMASGPALQKEVAANPSFVNVAGEWGRKLKAMSMDTQGPMATLRTVMTNLFQKSGPQSLVGGVSYSSADKTIAGVSGVSYSMIGETTPGTLYESLTETMMEDGFLSRFITVEYTGLRPAANENPQMEMDAPLLDAVCQLVQHSADLNARAARQIVGINPAARKMIYDFDKECDHNINGTLDESIRQMWNRAALYVMRLSALLAAGDNYIHPVIVEAHVTWALTLVRRHIQLLMNRLLSGDVGTGDQTRERKVMAICKAFVTDGAPKAQGVTAKMVEDGVIPRSYLALRTSRVQSFTTHRNGSSSSLDLTLKTLCDNGYLIELPKGSMFDVYGFSGKGYRILRL